MRSILFVALALMSAAPVSAAPLMTTQSGSTVIAQSPVPSHCNQRPYSDCIKCALERGFSPAEARAYCRQLR